MNIFFGILEQALTFTPLVLGMYISYSILKITDLTVDGTFVLGAAVFARAIHLGLLPALACSILAGALVGNIVAFMQRNNVVNDLIAGVLASFMLYSVNLQIMGRPNISLLDSPTILSSFGLQDWVFPLGLVSILVATCLFILLSSKFGLTLRAFGYNQKLLSVLGKSPENYRMFGLVLSNSLAALSGAIASQVNGFADINMGYGLALVGIGAVVIGRQFIKNGFISWRLRLGVTSFVDESHFCAFRELSACFLGILLYFVVLNLLLRFGINPLNLKLVLGLVLFVALSKIYKRGK